MAAIISSSSRHLPRAFVRVAVSKDCQVFPKAQVSLLSFPKQGQPLCSLLKHIKTSSYRPEYTNSWNHSILNLRTLRQSTVLCDEVRIVKVPQLAESLSEGDIRWDKGVGDTVAEGEVVGKVETDSSLFSKSRGNIAFVFRKIFSSGKTSVPLHSPCAGVIEELLVEDGASVQPGMPVFKIRVTAAASVSSTSTAAFKSTPAAEPSPTDAPGTTITGTRTVQRVKMNRIRQRIVQRLQDAQNTYAMLTTFNEVDMSNIIQMINAHKDEKHGIKLGFMSAFVRAASNALQDQPVVNAVIDDQEIVYRHYIDISVAVATAKGLVVPVIRNVEGMNYADIEKVINALGEKARTGSLAIEDMDGGTFMISNGGVFGSMFSTPIINPPQSAILGMHAIIDRPVVISGKAEIRPMMYICLTYDHRLIDGREAVVFLRKIKAAVEDPRILLRDV